VSTAKELLVLRFVTATAVSRGHFRSNGKSVVRLALLMGFRLVASETIDLVLRVLA